MSTISRAFYRPNVSVGLKTVFIHAGAVDRQTIQTAIYTLSLMTCVDFVPYDGSAEDYLLIWPVEEPAG